VLDFLKDTKKISDDLKFLWEDKQKDNVRIPNEIEFYLKLDRKG